MATRIANSVPLKEHTRCLINGFFRAWVVLLHSKRYLWFGLMKFRKPRHCGSNNFAARNCDQNKKRKNELSTVAFAFECAISGLFFFIFHCSIPTYLVRRKIFKNNLDGIRTLDIRQLSNHRAHIGVTGLPDNFPLQQKYRLYRKAYF